MKKQTIGRSDVVVKKYMLQSTIIMLRWKLTRANMLFETAQ